MKNQTTHSQIDVEAKSFAKWTTEKFKRAQKTERARVGQQNKFTFCAWSPAK